MLSAYEKSLDSGTQELDKCRNNQYYDEFVNRRELLFTNIAINESDTSGQAALHKENITSINKTIEQYKEKISKLNVVKQCIASRNNILDKTDSYYSGIVSSYIATYNYTSLQYDNQIATYNNQISDYDIQIAKASEEEGVDVVELKKQKEDLQKTVESVTTEKEKALLDLELQKNASVEQQISEYKDTILSLETNLASAKLQLEPVKGEDKETKEKAAILTEKGSIASEILTYQEKVDECEAYLKSYDIQNNNCTIRANISGYYYASQNLKNGSYVQESKTLGMIYPEQESKYYAEIYVENADIAKIKEGQEVKFEIAAYPSKEYGYFNGVIDSIAKDISVDQTTGYPYYLVKVKCENMSLKGDNGEEITLKNGMACQAKVVVDEKNVLTYILNKIDLLD
ncbi:MAG: HlyD family secretion protein [Lachnospiraceae bacterium]|nr:HlyD family secretion protein [Lachnospiraceae bacterium]